MGERATIMRPLIPALAVIAREELNETPDRIQQDLIILRAWIRQQTYLRARTTDEFLIAFLRRCRYSLEETKKRIDLYFSYYNIFPEIMNNRLVTERILDINRLGVHYYPEYPKSDNNTALLITRFGLYCPKSYNIRDVLKFIAMATEIIALENDNATVSGICQVIDLSGFSLERMRQVDNNLFKKWWDWMRDCAPIRLKEIYVINSSKEIQRWIAVMRTLTPEKDPPFILLKSVEELYEYIPKKCLPEEYGGCNGHIAECIAYMDDLLRSYRDYFEEDASYGTCEELRSGEVMTYEAQFGANGSFRKLQEE